MSLLFVFTMRVLLQSLLEVIGGFTLAMCSQEGLQRNAVTARRRRVFVNLCSGSEKSLLFFTDAMCGYL